MTKKQLALEVIKRLKEAYPDAGCTLEYEEAWKLLVSVRLAAQCTDARVNVVVKGLFEKYPTVDALAAAEVSDIEAMNTAAKYRKILMNFLSFRASAVKVPISLWETYLADRP